MKIDINKIKKEPLKKERLVYNGRTGNRIDVEVYLSPLRAMYKVGKEDDESAIFLMIWMVLLINLTCSKKIKEFVKRVV